MSSFNQELFTDNVEDYVLEKEPIVPQSRLYKGTFGRLGLPLAIRVSQTDDSEIELLENEMHIDSLTEHPNVIKIAHYFLQPERTWYTIFPYTPHKSLDILCQPYGLPEPVIAFVLADILDGLNYLHRNKIIHRAIQGSHILAFGDPKHSVKFVLTGLKHAYDMTKQDDLQAYEYPKESNSKSLKYMATEMLEQNIIGYNHKADIYSVGITVCELANGIVPFSKMETDQIIFYKIIGDTPGLFDSTSHELKILQKCEGDVQDSLQSRFKNYAERTFSLHFHHFVTTGCLHVEPANRFTAKELLSHPFIQTNLEQFGPRKVELLALLLSH